MGPLVQPAQPAQASQASGPGAPEAVQELQQAIRQRLERLGQHAWVRPGSSDARSLVEQPLVVFDLETTGLDLQRDVMISAGAVRIERCGVELGQSFERVLRQEAVALPATGQLFHGLTRADLAQGSEPRLALLDLLEYGQDALWLAWHAWFDQHMLHKAARHWLGLLPAQLPQVLDLAQLAPLLFPEHAAATGSDADLGRWLACFGLHNSQRHHAVADAMATAELALICLHRARTRGLRDWGQISDVLAQARHLRARAQQGDFAGF